MFIRRNGDTDAAGAENDLIRVDVGMNLGIGGVRYVLERSSADIRVWTTDQRTGPILTTQDETELTAPLTTFWVEWVTPGTAEAQSTLTLRLEDSESDNVVLSDVLVFHPFRSIVIVLCGWGQVPADPPNADHGVFFVARDHYREGYDVHMYDEDAVIPSPTATTGAAYDEVVNAVSNRGVTSVAIFGYSYGGGATYHLTRQVDQLRPAHTFTINFTAYVDAVIQDNLGGNPEYRRPDGTAWHLNFYQPNSGLELGRNQMAGDGPEENRADEDINTEVDVGFTRGLNHSSTDNSIDNDITVQTRLKNRLRSHVAK